MLKQRIITGVILASFVLLIIALPYPSFSIFTGVVLLIGVWEWTNLIPLKSVVSRCGYLIGLVILGAWLWISGWTLPWVLVCMCCWGLSLFGLLFYGHPLTQSLWANRSVAGVLGLVFLPGTFLATDAIVANSPLSLLALLMMVVLADSGAYFGGKQWGYRKLAPAISPGKTWEGMAVGLLLVVLFTPLWMLLMNKSLWFCAIMAFTVAIMSVVGDLSISALKRQRHLKDTGNILPGHGGVLDRMDSLLSTTVLYVCLYQVLPSF